MIILVSTATDSCNLLVIDLTYHSPIRSKEPAHKARTESQGNPARIQLHQKWNAKPDDVLRRQHYIFSPSLASALMPVTSTIAHSEPFNLDR